MSRRQVLSLVAALSAAAILAYLLHGFIWEHIILPLARLVWQISILYLGVPQLVLWILLLVGLVLLTLGRFALRPLPALRSADQRYAHAGDVQRLTIWLERRRRGLYSRWHLANTLANIALDMLRQRTGSAKRVQKLAGAGWNPPAAVQEYLEAGLKAPYGDYRRRSIFPPRPRTPFDVDLEAVIAYLESLVENEHGHQHS
jgi:hypothetical protein